jgi:branched-chain amino acid transport system permease protein
MQQFINGLTQGSIYALIALGYTMVYGVLRLINFAHGDVYMLGAFFGLFAANFMARLTGIVTSPLVTLAAFAVAMLGAALAGMLIERVAYRPLRGAPRLTLLITAIGVSMLLEYGGQLVFGSAPQGFPALLNERTLIETPSFSLSLVQVTIVATSVALMLALQFIVQKTKIGRAMRAVSLDRAAASLMGINTNVVIAWTFALGSRWRQRAAF